MKFLALSLFALALAPHAQAQSATPSASIYCSEQSFADTKAWKVNFADGKISTEGLIPSIDQSAAITLTKKEYPKNLPFPYGIYKGKVAGMKGDFELVIYGLNMFNTRNDFKSYIAVLSVGNKVLEDTTCYSN